MPPLNAAKIQEILTRLTLQRATIVAAIRKQLHASDDPQKLSLANYVEEVGDWTQADIFNDIDIAQLGFEYEELHDIDSALLRIKAGTYGICDECGTPISSARLDANSTARYCLDCQKLFEIAHGAVRHASL